MLKLSIESFKKIESWIYRNARPLEMAMWRYYFNGADKNDVISALSHYQNDDGGFGKGLDPDNWNFCSTPSVTSYACSVMDFVKCSNNDGLVIKTIEYLSNTARIDDIFWPTYMPTNNAYPHASWWDWRGSYINGWEYNPTIDLCSFIFGYANKDLPIYKKAIEIANYAIKCFSVQDGCVSFIYYVSLSKLLRSITENNVVINESISLFKEKLVLEIRECICTYEEQWGENFVAMPVFFVKSKNDCLYNDIADLLERNLDWIIDSSNSDGIWSITWCWSNYIKDFYISEYWWKSIIALERACILKSFDRIDKST